MNLMKTGALIRARREAAGLTQRALASQLHVTDKAVSKWERGLSCPDSDLLVPLAAVLNISEGELLRGQTQAQVHWDWRAAVRPWVTALLIWAAASLVLSAVSCGWMIPVSLSRAGEQVMSRGDITWANGVDVAMGVLRLLFSMGLGLWLVGQVHRVSPFVPRYRNRWEAWLCTALPKLTAVVLLYVAFFSVTGVHDVVRSPLEAMNLSGTPPLALWQMILLHWVVKGLLYRGPLFCLLMGYAVYGVGCAIQMSDKKGG